MKTIINSDVGRNFAQSEKYTSFKIKKCLFLGLFLFMFIFISGCKEDMRLSMEDWCEKGQMLTTTYESETETWEEFSESSERVEYLEFEHNGIVFRTLIGQWKNGRDTLGIDLSIFTEDQLKNLPNALIPTKSITGDEFRKQYGDKIDIECFATENKKYFSINKIPSLTQSYSVDPFFVSNPEKIIPLCKQFALEQMCIIKSAEKLAQKDPEKALQVCLSLECPSGCAFIVIHETGKKDLQLAFNLCDNEEYFKAGKGKFCESGGYGNCYITAIASDLYNARACEKLSNPLHKDHCFNIVAEYTMSPFPTTDFSVEEAAEKALEICNKIADNEMKESCTKKISSAIPQPIQKQSEEECAKKNKESNLSTGFFIPEKGKIEVLFVQGTTFDLALSLLETYKLKKEEVVSSPIDILFGKKSNNEEETFNVNRKIKAQTTGDEIAVMCKILQEDIVEVAMRSYSINISQS